MLIPPFCHAAACPVSPVPVQCLAPGPAPTALSGPRVPPRREGTPTRPCTGQPLPAPSPGDAREHSSPEMLRVGSPATWPWIRHSPRAAAALPGRAHSHRDSAAHPARAPSSCGLTQTTCALQTGVKGQAKAKSRKSHTSPLPGLGSSPC